MRNILINIILFLIILILATPFLLAGLALYGYIAR